MSLDITAKQEIAAPPDAVAAVMFDPANDTRWIGGISTATLEGEPPVQAGSRVARVARFMGKTVNYTNEIFELVPGVRLAMKSVVSPFPMRVTYAVEPNVGGTMASVRVQGDATPMYGLAGPFLAFFVKRNVQGDLRRLKRLIEAP